MSRSVPTLCVALSDMSDVRRQLPSLLDGLRRLNIAATIPPASRSLTATTSRRANAPAHRRAREIDGGKTAGRNASGLATRAGPPTAKRPIENAHPHFDATRQTRPRPQRRDRELPGTQGSTDPGRRHNFPSETDTEVLAHLIGKLYDDSVRERTADVASKRRVSSTPFARR